MGRVGGCTRDRGREVGRGQDAAGVGGEDLQEQQEAVHGGEAHPLLAVEHGLAQQEHEVVAQLGPLPLQREERAEHRRGHRGRQVEQVLEQRLEALLVLDC